jgi:heme exporter protein D
VSFSNWHDFLYMGGHYPFVWSAYAVGVAGVAILLARPLLARRRFFAEHGAHLRRQSASAEGASDASRPA